MSALFKDGCLVHEYCDDCGVTHPIPFILKDELWQRIKPLETIKGGHLCPPCAEKRLGRRMTLDDMKPCGMTDIMLLGVALYKQDPLPQSKRDIR